MSQVNNENSNFSNIVFMNANPSNNFSVSRENLNDSLLGSAGNIDELLGWQISWEDYKVKVTRIKNNGSSDGFNYLMISSLNGQSQPPISVSEEDFFPKYSIDNGVTYETMGFYFISASDYEFLTLESVSGYIFSISILDFGNQHVQEGSAENFDLIPILKVESIFSGLIPNYSVPRILLAPPCPPMWRPKLTFRMPNYPVEGSETIAINTVLGKRNKK
jgi:hypothetical protein